MHVPASRGEWYANVFLAIFNLTIHDLADQPYSVYTTVVESWTNPVFLNLMLFF